MRPSEVWEQPDVHELQTIQRSNKKDALPLRRIDQIKDLDEATVFSILDLAGGYRQNPLAESDIPK